MLKNEARNEEKSRNSGTDDLLKYLLKYFILGTSLAAQWLRLCTPNAGGKGSIPGGGTKIPHAVQHSQK